MQFICFREKDGYKLVISVAMSIRKSVSLQEPDKSLPTTNHHHRSMGAQDILINLPSLHSDHILSEKPLSSLSGIRRPKVPAGLQASLRGSRISGSEVSSVSDFDSMAPPKSRTSSRVTRNIRSSISAFRKKSTCQICTNQFRNKQKNHVSNCEHGKDFCQSCLHEYVIYKVQNFEEVYCPNDECECRMDLEGPFFKALPLQIQKKYKKIHQFQMISKDPNLKLCPKEECEGMIHMNPDGEAMVCDGCEREFCAKCLLERHEGECDRKEVEFFEGNLKFRQCKRCKFIVERSSGCNHMTCKCGYQFCYVCGARWNQRHYGNHDEQGNLLPTNPEDQECCDCCQQCCNVCCGEDCCRCWGACHECPTLGYALMLPVKLIYFILLSALTLLVFVSKDLVAIIGVLIISIFAGMFAYSCELLGELEDFFLCLGILFFPFLMLAGIGVAFGQLFCEVASQNIGQTCQMFQQGSAAIWACL